jgi:hypothetical protein
MWFGVQFLIAACALHYVIDVLINDPLRKLWENKRAKLHMMLFSFSQSLHIASLVLIYWLIGSNTIILDSILKGISFIFS